ncbi:MAG TPA: 3'-5' exonuclease [Burkholderiales bacterium]|nr:3'-5' exonuclease [Burkholderiales bacterium]
MAATLVFDIETVPDVAGYRSIHDIDASLSDAEVAELAFQRRRAASGNDFLPLHLQRVIAISCVLRDTESLKIWSLGAPDDTEAILLQRFFDGVEKYTPQLISWNGGGFDLPVLHYRSLVHGVVAARYWDCGEGDYHDSREFRYNNYINRYHTRHTDLMDVLAMFQARASAPLDQLAKLLGFPGKMGMDGSQVWSAFCEGRIEEIRNYCETDVLNTWLVFLRTQLMRGCMDRAQYDREIVLVRETLSKLEQAHWVEFLQRWPG